MRTKTAGLSIAGCVAVILYLSALALAGGDIDWEGYCKAHGHVGSAHMTADWQGWKCTDGDKDGPFVNIVMEDVCAWQYHGERKVPKNDGVNWWCEKVGARCPCPLGQPGSGCGLDCGNGRVDLGVCPFGIAECGCRGRDGDEPYVNCAKSPF